MILVYQDEEPIGKLISRAGISRQRRGGTGHNVQDGPAPDAFAGVRRPNSVGLGALSPLHQAS